MKSIKYVVLALLPLVSAVALANNAVPSQLVGPWIYDGSTGHYPEVATFNNDGSFNIDGVLTRSVAQASQACLVKIDGTLVISPTGSNQFSMTTTSAHLTLVNSMPGTTKAACEEMVTTLNQGGIFSLQDDITLAGNSQIKMHELNGNEATFKHA